MCGALYSITRSKFTFLYVFQAKIYLPAFPDPPKIGNENI